jgi:hypothetical protein
VEIDGINQNNPRTSLLELCEDYVNRWGYKGVKGTLQDLPGHVIFTGCIQEGKQKFTYVQDFAAYLRAHHLGRVKLSQVARNRINHPDHQIIVGIWSPNMRTLRVWHKQEAQP